jgi:hypothetical protein
MESYTIRPHQIERPYLKHLAKLVLDEDVSPQQFNTAPELFATYLGISEKTWHYRVRERFGAPVPPVPLGSLTHKPADKERQEAITVDIYRSLSAAWAFDWKGASNSPSSSRWVSIAGLK